MPKLLEATPLTRYRVALEYADGSEGEVDLSDLAHRGVFAVWDEPGIFESLSIGPQGQLRWTEEIELCPDAVYMRLTGKSPEEVFSSLRKTAVDA